MSRPPLANLFAVSADDPVILASIEADLCNSREFTEVWRPTAGWVAASQPLPGSESDGQPARTNGLAFAEGRDAVAGVSILARGHFARIEPRRHVVFGRYWNPRPSSLKRPSDAQAREHTERLRELLVEKLTRDLDPDGGNLLTLSGGVDSTSLAALATRVLRRPVWTWSLLPDPEDRYRREISYIAPLLEECRIERSWVVRLRADTRL